MPTSRTGTIYAVITADKKSLIPDDSIDIASASLTPTKRIAWFEGDQVGKEIQDYEFDKQNAAALNGFVAAQAVFFDSAEEIMKWENEFAPPVDETTGEIAWKEGVISETINVVKGWFK